MPRLIRAGAVGPAAKPAKSGGAGVSPAAFGGTGFRLWHPMRHRTFRNSLLHGPLAHPYTMPNFQGAIGLQSGATVNLILHRTDALPPKLLNDFSPAGLMRQLPYGTFGPPINSDKFLMERTH